jgi:alpha-beta hydrolase superfamily lysophospholipase
MRAPAGMVVASCLVCAVACRRAPDPGVRTTLPHPRLEADVIRSEDTFTGAGGVTLYAQQVAPSSIEPRAVLVIEHGLLDHGDRYLAFAQDLARRGYLVAMADLRGHGRSAGHRVTIGDFEDYVRDLDTFVARVRERAPGKPLFVLGHSMGGAIATLWAIERRPSIAGLILSAPALQLDAPPVQVALIRTFASIDPDAALFGLDERAFSRDPDVVRAMRADRLVYHRAAAIGTAAQIAAALHRIWTRLDRLTVPVLALHGTADRVTAPSGSRDLVEQATSSTDRTLKLYDGAYHDLLHDSDAAVVTADITDWMDARAAFSDPALAAGATDGVVLPERRRLRGDRGASALSLSVALTGSRLSERVGGDRWTRGSALDAGFTIGRWPGANPTGAGWHLGLDARLAGNPKLRDANLYPLGVGLRIGDGQVALSGGIGHHDAFAIRTWVVPVRLAVDQPLGPVHLLARATLAFRVSGEEAPETSALGSHHASALVGIRLGADIHYWSRLVAGRGLFLAATFEQLPAPSDASSTEPLTAFGLALGFDLWAAN